MVAATQSGPRTFPMSFKTPKLAPTSSDASSASLDKPRLQTRCFSHLTLTPVPRYGRPPSKVEDETHLKLHPKWPLTDEKTTSRSHVSFSLGCAWVGDDGRLSSLLSLSTFVRFLFLSQGIAVFFYLFLLKVVYIYTPMLYTINKLSERSKEREDKLGV